ncbi:hypothetical protein C483_08864 [Natrialba hulunbeirensis JCM 10989]|uniref:Small CPxCG-related zinc finger protein n=1 Tax=Natrialba hulunbeirensis JCM 10989 TaxID=1227493 RepID=L9ZZE4_9EURY|nr:hypothetical protein C483_08864 [Natrialba hulunbeirensis JCM 10989]
MPDNDTLSQPESMAHRQQTASLRPQFVFTCDACHHQIEIDESVATAIMRHGCPICGSGATAACLRRAADTPPPDH